MVKEKGRGGEEKKAKSKKTSRGGSPRTSPAQAVDPSGDGSTIEATPLSSPPRSSEAQRDDSAGSEGGNDPSSSSSSREQQQEQISEGIAGEAAEEEEEEEEEGRDEGGERRTTSVAEGRQDAVKATHEQMQQQQQQQQQLNEEQQPPPEQLHEGCSSPEQRDEPQHRTGPAEVLVPASQGTETGRFGNGATTPRQIPVLKELTAVAALPLGSLARSGGIERCASLTPPGSPASRKQSANQEGGYMAVPIATITCALQQVTTLRVLLEAELPRLHAVESQLKGILLHGGAYHHTATPKASAESSPRAVVDEPDEPNAVRNHQHQHRLSDLSARLSSQANEGVVLPDRVLFSASLSAQVRQHLKVSSRNNSQQQQQQPEQQLSSAMPAQARLEAYTTNPDIGAMQPLPMLRASLNLSKRGRPGPGIGATQALGGYGLIPPSRVKFKVTDDVKAAIRQRIKAHALAPTSMDRNTSLFATKDQELRRLGSWSSTPKAGRATVDQEVEIFIEITCGDITNKDPDILPVERGSRKPWFILDPVSTFRVRWDLFILVILTWSAFSILYRAAFTYGLPVSSEHMAPLDILVNTIFLIDMALNFLTAYYEDSILVTDWRRIAWHYARSWLLIDFASSVPITDSSHSDSTNFIRLCKLVKLFRYASYLEAKASAMYISATIIRLANIILFIIWFWHSVACGYWYLSVKSGLGVSEWALSDAENTAQSRWINYLRSLEWSLQTTFSYSPTAQSETTTQAYFTIFAIIGGVLMTSVIIGGASTALQSLDAEKEVRRQRMDKVMNYLKRRKIPSYFQKIVLDYYGYMSDKHSQDSIIQELPVTIQARMTLLLNRDLLKYVPALRVLDLNSVISLMQSLYSRVFLPGEYVFKAGDAGLYLYFIKTGACEIVLPDGKNVACNLIMGDVGGQIALISDSNHDFGLRACVYSEVLLLEKEIYNEIASESERFAEYVETEAIKQEQIVRTATANLTRFVKLAQYGDEQEQGEAAEDGVGGNRKDGGVIGNIRSLFTRKNTYTRKRRTTATAARVLPYLNSSSIFNSSSNAGATTPGTSPR